MRSRVAGLTPWRGPGVDYLDGGRRRWPSMVLPGGGAISAFLANLKMAQLSKNPVGAGDLTQFVNERSDVAFEMEVLAILRGAAFACSHSGTYRDPVTDKIRQHDIRAVREVGRMGLALAVECKNLQDNSPLLLSAVPRSADESFHHVFASNVAGLGPGV